MPFSERDALNLWRRALTHSIRSNAPDLTARQQAVLMTVALTPGPHTVRGLAQYLRIAKPAITRAVDALSKLDLVERVKDERDLRNVFIQRTVSGANYLRALGGLISAAAAGKELDEASGDASSRRAA